MLDPLEVDSPTQSPAPTRRSPPQPPAAIDAIKHGMTPAQASSIVSDTSERISADPPTTKYQRCRRRFVRCLHRWFRLPHWLAVPLYYIYTRTSGIATYLIIYAAVFCVFWPIRPSVVALPTCRFLAAPVFSANQSHTAQTHERVIECVNGEALTVLILYAFGFALGDLMELLHLPGLLGMLLGGMFLRNLAYLLVYTPIHRSGSLPTNALEWADPANPFNISSDSSLHALDFDSLRVRIAGLLVADQHVSKLLRELALTTILTRAGLGIDPSTLARVAASVFRLAFIPCFVEAFTVTVVSRWLIGWDWSWAAILGFVIAAASPAVIVPNMMRLEVMGWGVAKGIPTLVVAASSIDDVVAITGFGVALSMAFAGGDSVFVTLIRGPAEALLGAVFGAVFSLLLLFFPPPKLEHSHLIRGFLLLCLAITGLVGSSYLEYPGAGALACLTLAFFVASGWRAGLPWRITQPPTKPVPPPTIDSIELKLLDQHLSSDDSDDDEPIPPPPDPLQPPFGRPPSVTRSSSANPPTSAHQRLPSIGRRSIDRSDRQRSDSNIESSSRRRRQQDSVSSSVLHTLVEYPEHYLAVWAQQYATTQKQSISSGGTQGGDLPSLAVAIAATGSPIPILGARGPSSTTGPPPSSQTRAASGKSLRRFSLPEPTAHYELESFGAARGSTTAPRSGSIRALSQSRRRIVSPSSVQDPRRANILEEDEEYEWNDGGGAENNNNDDFESLHERRRSSALGRLSSQDERNDDVYREKVNNDDAFIDEEATTVLGPRKRSISVQFSNASTNLAHHIDGKSGDEDDNDDEEVDEQIEYDNHGLALVTPQDRGLACLNSMRQTLAALWFFVQPILFSLIGAEVNIADMKASSTGIGIACILIAIVMRVLATILALLPSKNFNMKERLFVAFSWLPKATVQAAIGPVALDTARKKFAPSLTIDWGERVLTLAALSILITAPLGAILMPLTAPYLLEQDLGKSQVIVKKKKKKNQHKHFPSLKPCGPLPGPATTTTSQANELVTMPTATTNEEKTSV